jgi:hypothetical protein
MTSNEISNSKCQTDHTYSIESSRPQSAIIDDSLCVHFSFQDTKPSILVRR